MTHRLEAGEVTRFHWKQRWCEGKVQVEGKAGGKGRRYCSGRASWWRMLGSQMASNLRAGVKVEPRASLDYLGSVWRRYSPRPTIRYPEFSDVKDRTSQNSSSPMIQFETSSQSYHRRSPEALTLDVGACGIVVSDSSERMKKLGQKASHRLVRFLGSFFLDVVSYVHDAALLLTSRKLWLL